MNPVARALWFIESKLHEEIDLAVISEGACVSRFHLCRVFGAITGMNLMAYVRIRRLERAAEYLMKYPDESLLQVAMSFGYGSNAAFARAFRARFDVSPSQFRRQPRAFTATHIEIMNMASSTLTSIKPSRLQHYPAFTVAGFSGRYTWETNSGIPSQWAELSISRIKHLFAGSISRIKHLFAGCCPLLTDADSCVQRSLRRTDRR